MNKEYLEALERLAMPDELHIKECIRLGIGLTDDYDLIKEALLELKAIKEANPSEALKSLSFLKDESIKDIASLKDSILTKNLYDLYFNDFDNIQQVLVKAQEQEKENEILKEIIKSFFDRGCPLHQYIDSKGGLQIEVDYECSNMILGEYKGVDLDKKLKEVLNND